MNKDLNKIKNEIDSVLEDLSNLQTDFTEDYKKLVSKYRKNSDDGKLQDQQ